MVKHVWNMFAHLFQPICNYEEKSNFLGKIWCQTLFGEGLKICCQMLLSEALFSI